MAEVTKKKKQEKYNLEEIKEEVSKSSKKKEETKKEETKKEEKKKNSAPKKEEKKSLWVRFRIFCHGVKSEFEKVHWTTKKDMIKYSIATFVSVLFFATFFYFIEVLFAFLLRLF